jgi:hypothetical protein
MYIYIHMHIHIDIHVQSYNLKIVNYIPFLNPRQLDFLYPISQQLQLGGMVWLRTPIRASQLSVYDNDGNDNDDNNDDIYSHKITKKIHKIHFHIGGLKTLKDIEIVINK